MQNRLLSLISLLYVSTMAWGAQPVKILVLGDSLTEGYGLTKEQAFPALLETKFQQGGYSHVRVINGGVSGSTSSSAVSRLTWYLKTKPHVLVLALGANDGLRGVPVAETRKNLVKTIQLAKKHNLKIILAGMQLPPNYAAYAADFGKMFPAVAKQEGVPLIPFLLDGVAGNPSLNLPDGVHPNADGQTVIAEKVYPHLLPLL